MEKYKICPSCGEKNDPALFECLKCETDLTGVKITDEETEKMLAEQEAQPEKQLVRICDCGEKNPSNARKCAACGEDISDVLPQEVEAEKPQVFVLTSLDGEVTFPVTEAVVIGREKAMSDYLEKKPYVSRTHARLTPEEGGLWVENLSNTNYTYVNNRRITEKTQLQPGDELGLGGTGIDGNRQEQAAYFTVETQA